MNSPYLVRRLHYLYTTERRFVYVFGALMGYVAVRYPIRRVMLLLYGLGVVAYLLFQGQRYWQVKLARLQGKPLQEAMHLAFFRRAKKTDLWLLRIMPFVCLLQVVLEWPITFRIRFLPAALVNVFAVLEYINYYQRQLMIDTLPDVNHLRRHRKLKVASLAKDLAAQKL